MKEAVYVSGRITGLTPEESKERFLEKGIELASQGKAVFLPTENNRDIGIRSNWGWKDYMRVDLEMLKRCDTIYMLSNWKESRGARMEHWLAKRRGMRVIYEEEPFLT